MSKKVVLGLMGAVLTTATVASAGSVPIGPLGTEFQVNTYTSGNQYQTGHAICKDEGGNFVIVWQSGSSLGSSDQDGDMAGIFGQRYASNGKTRGTEFQVNSFTLGSQSDPAVCCQPDGDFTVAWTVNGPVLTIFDHIDAQRFASSGAPLGTEFQVSAFTTDFGFNPDICCSDAGDFVVVWDAFYGFSDLRIKGQRFNSAAVRQGTEFQVNTYTSTFAFDPGVCCNAAGDFVVAWSEVRSDFPFDSDVFGRRYASGGATIGTEFQVNTYTEYFQGQAIPESDYGAVENQALCCTPTGDFRVAWTTVSYVDADIRSQRFTSTGAFLGTEFQVNSYTTEYQGSPAACCDADGSFIVVWTGDTDPRLDSHQFSVFGRRFAVNGDPIFVDFQVNTYTSGSMYFPAIACGPENSFVVSWSQYPNQDGNQDGVFAQGFQRLDIVPTPTLSWVGLASGLVTLLFVAVNAFRRRRG